MQTEAYRSYGVNGICPWTMFEDPSALAGGFDLNTDRNTLYQAQKAATHPNAVFVQPYNTRFFVGDTLQRSLSIYNDTMEAGKFVLKCRSGEGEPCDVRAFNMDPADRRVESVTFKVPDQPGPFTLQIDLDNGATPVFSKALAYSAHPRPTLSLSQGISLGVYDPKGNTTDLLARNGLGYIKVADLRTARYDRLSLLLIGREASKNLARLAAYVEQGGRLLLHRPSGAFLTVAQAALFPDLEWADSQLGLVLRRDSTEAAVSLANHDLYWIDQAGSWDRPETLSTNVARRIYRKRFNLTSYSTIQVEAMPVHTTGSGIAGGWALYASGSVAQDVTVSRSGTYLFSVKARGTPVAGVYPLMSLRIDGRGQDSVYVNSETWAFYTLRRRHRGGHA